MKKKFSVFVVFVLIAVFSIVGLTACDTDTTHRHKMQHHTKVEATCTTDGQIEYWSCSECGKNYADEKGEKEVSDLVIKATGHNFVNGVCSKCGIVAVTKGLEFELTQDKTGYVVSGVVDVTDSEIFIPEKYNDLPVVGIKDWAFSFCMSVNKVHLTNNITRIGSFAFFASGIDAIDLPNSVTDLGENAFSQCINLKKVTLTDSITEIKSGVFYSCLKLKTIQIPKSVVAINIDAFMYLTDLNFEVDEENPNYYSAQGCLMEKATKTLLHGNNSGIIPEGTERIASFAFAYMTGFYKLVVPNGVKTIEDGAFRSSSLTEIVLPNSVVKIGDFAFETDDIVIYCESTVAPEGLHEGIQEYKNIILDCKNQDIDEKGYIHTIVDGIDYKIKDNKAAVNCQVDFKNKNIVIPKNITYQNIEYSVCAISRGAFSTFGIKHDVSKLRLSITIPSTVEIIESYAINQEDIVVYCEGEQQPIGWEQDWVPSSTKVIFDCINNKQDKDGYMYAEINNFYFALKDNVAVLIKNLDNTSKEIVVPDSVKFNSKEYFVKKIVSEAFGHCNVEKVVMADSIVEMEDTIFNDCYYLKEIKFSKNLKTIGWLGSVLFQLNNVEIPDGVVEIGENAFYECVGMVNIKIPNNLEKIGDCAFIGCYGLKSIILPKTLKSIGSAVFNSEALGVDSKFEEIKFLGTMQEWNAISKAENWAEGAGEFKVVCIDGTLDKNDNFVENV